MTNLPYLDPNKELSLQAGVVLILLEKLAETKRGKLVLNFERLQVFFYLIQKPTSLNSVLRKAGKSTANLKYYETYSVNTVSHNIDALTDRSDLKAIIQYLASRSLLKCEYTKSEGFVFSLSEIGAAATAQLESVHFADLRRLAESLISLQTQSVTKLRQFVKFAYVGAA